jgi:hypothetical protein
VGEGQSTKRERWEKSRALKEEGGRRPQLWKKIVGEGNSSGESQISRTGKWENARALKEEDGRRQEN